MATVEFIAIRQFCQSYNIEISFIHSLNEHGLVELTGQGDDAAIPVTALPQVERVIRLYYEMGINLEGIDAITHLLERMESLQDEVRVLRNQV